MFDSARSENFGFTQTHVYFCSSVYLRLQMCVVPAYALTIHKTQALTISHWVLGCLEGTVGSKAKDQLSSKAILSAGSLMSLRICIHCHLHHRIFAMGQVYVLVSRVTDPLNFMLLGVPPKDLIEDVAAALIMAGIDVDKYFEDACSVTRDFVYDKEMPRVRARIRAKTDHERTIMLKFRTLDDILNPQPQASIVISRLLGCNISNNTIEQHNNNAKTIW